MFNIPPSPLQELFLATCKNKEIRLFVKRDDLLHPIVSGNKWRKLSYNLSKSRADGKKTLLTFGGAYSNHIHAVAAAGKLFGFNTIGLIRGEEPAVYGATLAYAKSCGMCFHFLSRVAYRKKEIPLELDLSDTYVLPEGGTNEYAIQGCSEIVKELLGQLPDSGEPTYHCVSCGTGGTVTGIIEGLQGRHQVLGFSALKGEFLQKEIQNLQKEFALLPYDNWAVNSTYHFGGYARHQPALIEFLHRFYEDTNIPLDPIYTGKMVYGVLDLIEKGYFPKGSHVVMIHTGGLQGIIGFNERFDMHLPGGKL